MACLILAICGICGATFGADRTLRSGEPADVAMSAEKLGQATALLEEAVQKDALRGAVALVARRGVIVLHHAVGWRDFEQQLPMETHTLFRMASNTKPVIATAVLTLVEAKKLDLDDNVRKHIPAWDNYRAGFVKVRHLLTHTSGLRMPVIFLDPLVQRSTDYPEAPCLRAEVDRFGQIGPDDLPGTRYAYSNPGYNTLGRLIEIASGESIEDYLRRKVYEPLGMRDAWNYEASAPQQRMARVYRRRDDEWRVGWSPGDGPDFPFVRASGGMITTAQDYAVFCQMYLNGGVYAGTRILGVELAKRATVDQTGLHAAEEAYGFGWRIEDNGVFGHAGSDGTYAWVDPQRELFGIVLTQCTGVGELRQRFREQVESACIGD